MLTLKDHEGVWKNSDPRDLCSYGYYSIVIVRPGPDDGKIVAGFGDIDTKHDWMILTSFPDHRVIHADDKWDFAWWWTLAPQM